MIIVDTELARRAREERPIRVGISGAGYMGRGTALQIARAVPGIELAAIASRDASQGTDALMKAGLSGVDVVETQAALEAAVAERRPAATNDPLLVARARGIDAVIEVTGDVEAGALLALEAIANGKHVVLMNAELAGTLGSVLKDRADRAGVVITYTDGDEPGLILNLSRYVRSIGLEPVLVGNLKGLLDPYRTPETQQEFAAAVGQKARMVTSFADGTKLALEAVITANALGFGVLRRGMVGHRCDHVNQLADRFKLEDLLRGGVVDFVLGAEPGSGAFVVAHCDDPQRAEYLRYFKLGDGPLYTFYQPWHLPNFDVPLTVARAVLFGDAAVTPLGPPTCHVVASAKRDLTAGTALDGIGGFDCYGVIENAAVVTAENLVPIGLAGGCRLVRDLDRDSVVSFDDVEVPGGRLADALWAEQTLLCPNPSRT